MRVPRPSAADVVIPIYGAAEELAACLAAVAGGTGLTRHCIVLVLDGPQDEAVETVVGSFAAAHVGAVRVLRSDARLGFAATVNRGMAASSRDVVLLNSDTIVTADWLEKLIDAAYASGDTGTVTPLSNDATLCSVPRPFAANLLPAGYDADSFGRLVERVSARSYPRLPTGVGFCLYIRRAVLDDVGAFDAVRFPRGYGEENDFCLRALARGWLHVADDATFVYHAGHRSFGASRAAEQRRGRAALSRLHRRYLATIAAFMERDPLAEVRARIAGGVIINPSRGGAEGAEKSQTSAISASPRDRPSSSILEGAAPQPCGAPGSLRIVHLVHGWPPFQHAGTELYAYWLVARQRERHEVGVYTRSADPSRSDGEALELLDGGVRVRLVTNHFTARNPLRRNAIRDRALERDFERFLRSQSPHLLHVHHLAGHTFSLLRVARRLGIPIVVQIQDWWYLCARVNLLDRDGNRCTGPAPAKCARCATLTRLPPATFTNRLVHRMRRSSARAALRCADVFIAGSNAIRADYAGAVPRRTPFHVIPYGIALDAPSASRAPVLRPLRFGYVGSIAPHKGVHVAVEAMRTIDPSDAVLHVWGDTEAYPEYVRGMTHGASVVFEGRFREEEKPSVYAAMDVLLVPSIGLESFGLAAREAMACGVPVVASAGGALSEMFEAGACGELVPPGDAAALRAVLQRLIGDPALVDRWSAHLPQPKRDDVHADEIERVYRSLLAGRER